MTRAESARWILLSSYASLALGLATAPLVARSLGTSGRGHYGVILATGPAIAIIAGLGIPWAARTYLSTGTEGGDILAGARRISRATTPLVGLSGFIIGYATLGETIPALCATLYMLAAGSAVLRTTYSSILLFSRQWIRLALYSFAPSALSTVGVLILYSMGRLTVASALLANAIALSSQMLWLRNSKSNVAIPPRELVRRGAGAWPLQVAEILYVRSDQVAVYVVLGSSAAGLYSVVAIGVQLSFFIVSAMAAPILLLAAKPEAELGKQAAKAVSAAIGSLIPLWILAQVLGPVLIPAVFGQEFSGSTRLIPAGAVFSLSVAIWYFSLHLTLLRGGVDRMQKVVLVGIPFLVAGSLMLVAHLLEVTTTITVLTMSIAQAIAGGAVLRHVHHVPLTALWPRFDLAAKFFFSRARG